MSRVDFVTLEQKWQKAWEKERVFEVKEDKKKKKFYVLEMFPYPSASGLHMGHAFNYTIGDIFARFKRMSGFNVLHPIGFDSLGLPAENAAIKEGIHPKKYTESSIANFERQFKSLGISYDWSRMIVTHDPLYYKWDQWIFLKMFEKGLAFRKKAIVNYCPKCETVLANEQVEEGKCWRHKDTSVEIKPLEQWFFKITDFADELYEKIGTLNEWPERIKAMQKNWIGKSYGTEIYFEINGEKWPVFTTRPDTIYGVTFLVISAQHPRLMELVDKKCKKDVESFLKKIKSTSERDIACLEKEGEFTGSFAINPLTQEKIPVYTGNFVVADYGCGMVMAAPAHDQRDFEFAKKYDIPIKLVIQPKKGNIEVKSMKEAYTGEGILVNSGKFDGMNSKEAIKKITAYLEEKKLGKGTVQYKLRDWLVSRQRYWGTPIPIVYCKKCGIVPVLEEDLPVELPEKVKFGEGNPLLTNSEFVNTNCPKCKGPAKRETDTMDTFVNSSWYFLRYCDPDNNHCIFDKEKTEYWTPVDVYIGGAEHACMHLIYFRFYTKFFRDLGLIDYGEPVIKLFNQGMVYGSDGFMMSKSRGNGIDPLDMIKKYGADTLRFYLVSNASPDKDFTWSDEAVEGSFRFIRKVMDYFSNVKIGKSSELTESKYNRMIKEISDDIDNFRYNAAVIKLRELFESFKEQESKNVLEGFIKLLHPFCPHITEEIWHNLGNKTFISIEEWPKADETKINLALEMQEKMIIQTISDIKNIFKLVKEKQKKDVKKVWIYPIPKELNAYIEHKSIIEKILGVKVNIFGVNDKNRYDPQNKASKAKLGKPAIYVE